MAISRDRLYTIVMTPLLAAFIAAAADGIVNGNEQDARCEAVMAETIEAVKQTSQNLEQFANGDTEISIHVSKDMRDDPGYPRFPLVGNTTCFEYVTLENPAAPE